MKKISNHFPHTLTLTIHQIPGNNPSNFHPIHTIPHIQMIHRLLNTPLPGNRGQHGPTGANPTTLPSQRDNGRTTRSPTISPTKRANGLTTRNHHMSTPPHMIPPLAPSLPFPPNLLTVIVIPNAINADPDLLNPDSPHSLQGMSHWIYMAPVSTDGKPT